MEFSQKLSVPLSLPMSLRSTPWGRGGGPPVAVASPTPGQAAHFAKERVRVLAPGGGYVLAPANHFQPDVPARNVIALFEAARKYGRY